MATIQQRMTLDQFLALPEKKPALEFENGEVTQKVPPRGRHSALQEEICALINTLAKPAKLARAFPELRTTYAGFSRVPDIAVYLWDRIPRTANGIVADVFLEPPDIAVEIVSPKQSVNALVRRCTWYVDNGVQIALLVDPDDQSVAVFRPGAEPIVCRGIDEIDLTAVLPGFHLTAGDLFASLML
ncbi:MAG: hypothetical protein HW416_885 [Chloroflexi bacterium]|nr:hypothetical protein [Chloroflexota bacterium]